jgi:hypothetical protein
VNPPLDALTGAGRTPTHFDLLDMSYRIRIRAFVGIVMPPIFRSLDEHLKMMALRKQGYAPIMFSLDFRSAGTPIAFSRSLDNEHTLKLFRSIAGENNRPAQHGTERLMFVSNSIISGRGSLIGSGGDRAR